MATAYRRDTLELELESIHGDVFRPRLGTSVDRLVTVSLIWPRPLMAERVAIRTLRFEKDGLDLARQDWSERILFKENVEGPFGIVVQVSETLTAQALKRIIAGLGVSVLRTAGSEAARLASGPWLSTLARFPFAHLSGDLSGAAKTPQVVAAGRITLLPGNPGPIEIPLAVPEDIVHIRRARKGDATRTRRKTLHHKGAAAGTVRLNARYYRG